MRIALVTAQVAPIREPQIGGAQVMVADLARGLAARGHDVAVYAPRGSLIDGVRIVDTGVDPARLRATRLHSGSSVPPRAIVTAAFERIVDLVAQQPWDCVHNHAFDAPAITATASLRCPVVHTLHLPPDARVAEALAHTERRSTVVAVSAAAARAWSAVTRIDAVVRNGVPTSRIPWSAEPGAGLLFVGRLSPEKGGDIAALVASRTGVRLTVIGDDHYDRAWAARLIAGADPAVVQFLPTRARDDVWLAMRDAGALLAPSRWEEPFGLSVAEAQTAGTPVVATRRGALPEIVQHGKTGWIVDDVEGAIRAVGRLAEIDRVACRRRAEAELDIEPMVDAYERLYREAGGRQDVAAAAGAVGRRKH